MAPSFGGLVASGLSRASLAIHQPPTDLSSNYGGKLGEVRFEFNPDQLQLSRSASWFTEQAVAYDRGAPPKFTGSQPAQLQLEVFLDRSGDPSSNDVKQQVELLLSCCEVTQQSIGAKAPSPPWVQFTWGSFSTVQFVAYVTSVSATYTLFSPSGMPIRATCSLALTEISSATKKQNPTSGALSARRVHRTVAGDSLASLAWREYGDATRWRVIAEANRIDDPMRLRPGTELLLPSTTETPETEGAS
ncbi:MULTISPECIES: LysM peptidoglycan-binding domain-containing protein [Streptomyces]|uniref:CIS tube protein n=1 Tax=Streptomyces TaxID=1883 RepID=UPI00093F561C|nr:MULTISPECIES: LysM peptidoglycan-binding domain-containing protein [Streptomyces]MBX9421084.1 LysM peptidoglycan-binding domain-containing protein [Streptomyces lateritius]OKJ64073.1 peptidase M23 [Streptomyces sp. CB02261]